MATLLSDIFARIRRRCDMVNSTFLDDALDILPWFNSSLSALQELLVTSYGDTYFLTTGDITLSASVSFVDINGMFKLLRVDTAFDGERVPLKPFSLSDHTLHDQPRAWGPDTDVRYLLSGTVTGAARLAFSPVPTADHVLRVYYVPGAGNYTSFSAATIVGYPEFWDEYIVVDCAIKAKIKADEDASALLLEKAEIKQRIMDAAPNFDAGQPSTTVDAQGVSGGDGANGWWW